VPDETDHADLEEELRRVVAQIDSVPPALLEAAVGAFAWRTIDADLAELVFDSLVDHDRASLVRGAGHGRMLSFRASTLTIDVEVTSQGDSRMLVGQLVPPQPATVDIRQRDRVITTEADELGRFSAGPLQAGPTSLRCRVSGDIVRPSVATDWVAI
jgi:hypothetical protein